MKKNFSIPKGEKLLVSEKGRKRFIEIEKITHITCEGHISTIHTIDKNKIHTYKLLKEYENELKELRFIRTNNNSLCNLSNISEYRKKGSKHILIMVDDSEVEISKRKLPNIRKVL